MISPISAVRPGRPLGIRGLATHQTQNPPGVPPSRRASSCVPSYAASPQNFNHRGIANPSAKPTGPGYLASTPLVLCLSSEIACRNRLQGNGPIQLTTDGFRPYLTAVEDAFGAEIDYAQLVKLY